MQPWSLEIAAIVNRRGCNAEDARAIGQRILGHRRRLGLSQRELAALIGLSQKAIGGMEHGKHGPSVEVLRKLCAVFGLTATELLGF